jgi:hypothetical protein
MIDLSPSPPEWAAREAVAAYLAAEVQALAGADGADEYDILEVARGVAAFLEHTRGLEGSAWNSEHLRALTSRALATVGAGDLAQRLLVFGAGIAASVPWLVVEPQGMIVLDMERLASRPQDRLELICSRTLIRILETLAPVWDETGGEGALGLRHLAQAAGRLAATFPAHPSALDIGGEFVALCRGKLELLRNQRGWAATPRVLRLDTPARPFKRRPAAGRRA